MKKIVLLCSAGFSTSMLVKKMRRAAEAQGYPCTIKAIAIQDFRDERDADVMLLAPQAQFRLSLISKSVDCPVALIDMPSYGAMDGESVLARAQKLMSQHETSDDSEQYASREQIRGDEEGGYLRRLNLFERAQWRLNEDAAHTRHD